jgi:hypothetical protein
LSHDLSPVPCFGQPKRWLESAHVWASNLLYTRSIGV